MSEVLTSSLEMLDAQYHSWAEHIGIVQEINGEQEVREIIKTDDIAFIYRCSPGTVTNWARNGTIPHFKTLGNQNRYHTVKIFEYGLQQLAAYPQEAEQLQLIADEIDQEDFEDWAHARRFVCSNRAGQMAVRTFLTAPEVANVLETTVQTVHDWTNGGDFFPLKLTDAQNADRRFFTQEVYYNRDFRTHSYGKRTT